ncbi:CST complex subunit CTC1 isoform X2 [Euphorbia lathyris]|uniref:CST complex subunit CTC1 isoform X2 n=1 Tax=Euphorbia lathyris TaxID=212925 RepID=UPI003313895E
MEDDAIKLLTISELLRLGRPHTATSSINSAAPSFSVLSSSSNSESRPHKNSSSAPTSTDSSPNHNVLLPLSHPAILTGTLTLPPETLKCPNGNCFQFSDGSSTICCDILGFSVNVIGKKIQVLAWNFIPLKHSAGGVLEIIKWKFSVSSTSSFTRCSSMDSIPLASCSSSPLDNKDKEKARYRVHGPIDSISPVSLVPCSFGATKSCNLRGFIVRIMACECKLCNSKDSIAVLHNLGPGRMPHSFTKPLFIYFHGSFSSWHPVISKIVGNVITLLGLKRKLIFIGKEQSHLMFVTTGSSVLHLPRLAKKLSLSCRNVMAGKGELGAYTGTISGVYMQGMVFELDKRVWLLLTDHLLAAPHSLRVGAVVSLRNVHFVNPKFTWTQMLILGSCFQTCITVESFSPLETGLHVVSRSPSQLGKFIESLTFSARLWALLVISCFRKKFASSLSEKEILGSKHLSANLMWMFASCNQREGLAQVFTRSHLHLSVIQARHAILTEFCKHDSCSCGGEPLCSYLKLVAPISTILHFLEARWRREMLQHNHCYTKCHKTQSSLPSCEGRSHSQSLKRIFRSDDIGFSLLGSLKTSSSSGRLQLVDATGSIDVIVPDLPSTWKSNSIYEVLNYSLIVEGTPEIVGHQGLPGYETLSCRNIFHCLPWAGQANLTIYMCFQLSHANSGNLPFYPCVSRTYDFMELQDNKFHLICISHKFPMLQKFQGVPVISDRSTVFAEAIILPWDLFLAGKDGNMLRHRDSGNQFNEQSTEYPSRIYEEHLPSKKRKVDKVSCPTLVSDLMNGCNYSCSEAVACSSSCEGYAEGKCENLSSLEIPCLATIRTANGHSLLGSGKLCLTNYKLNIGNYDKSSAQKVLLEFNSENLFKYQIGSYYIIMHSQGESFCSIKDYNIATGAKVFISSGMHMWNLSFSSEEEATYNGSTHDSSQDDSFLSCRENPIKDKVEVHLRSMGSSPKSSSDVCLHLSANAMVYLELKLNEIKETLLEAPMTPEQSYNDFHEVCLATSMSGFSSGSLDFSNLFPEGNLTSVQGSVVAIHSFDGHISNGHLSCEKFGDVPQMRFFQENKSCSCIHVLINNQMASVFGSLSNHAYLVGFGANVNATFHRVLELRGTNKFKLTPVSFIVLNSIRIVDEPTVEKSSDIQPSLYISSASSLNGVSSGMISEFQCKDCKPMQVTGRIVAVHILVLEKNRKYNNLNSETKSKQDFVDIPVMGFVLDDGSSMCCCWANAESAATLLRLHDELPARAFGSSGCKLKCVGIEKGCWKSTMFHLERILRKHDKIILRNTGLILDSPCQDLTVSVSSDDFLSISDENLLKFIISNACVGTLWTVVASVMDSIAVDKLEKEHFIQMETTACPMQNIWATEVRYVNILTEARNTIQELLDK